MSFTCTNLAKPEPRGDPLYKAMQAPFNSEAYTSQGPIIHPRLVGQATTSPLWISMWHHASAAALKGVALVQGIAFGSPTTANNPINQTLSNICPNMKAIGLATSGIELIDY